MRLYIILPVLVLLALGAIGACSPTSDEAANPSQTEIELAPASKLPDKVKQAPPVVQEAYRFAIANPELLEKFPCYCSCGNMGHMSNLNCFVKEFNPDGSIVFDDHALGWSICVDIARDAMRMTAQGKSPVEIREYVDRQYSKFGPPTNTEPVVP